MSAQVFVSHSSKDQQVARAICTALENRGLACWIAERDVGPGEDFQEAIVKAIRSTKIMVLVFTENANNSNEIKKELVLASQNNLVIIPARVENVAPNDALAFQFATRQWVDLFKDWEREIERLGTWIASILSIDPAAGAASRPVEPASHQPAGLSRETDPLSESATTKSMMPLSNPISHYVGAFLIVVGLFGLVFCLAAIKQSFDVCAECTIAPRIIPNSGEVLVVPPFPFSPRSISIPWSITAIILIAFASMIAVGLGTIKHQGWTRIPAFWLCIIGCLTSAYLTISIAEAVYQFAVPPSDPNTGFIPLRCIGDVCSNDPINRIFGFLIPISLLAILLLLLATLFSIAAWAFLRARQPGGESTSRRANMFVAFGLFICALTGSLLVLSQIVRNQDVSFGLLVLVALDVAALTYCCFQFRRQFGFLGAPRVAPS